ncbi:peptidoglycan hydrolase CwlO-like protein [Salirhabdus euzebyi]|uniref:Peptidoglycan hydrolase CwlO-like protein n=1 Tax=Salirhabdus euzebyi TaxID=394506 RepID=A0A841Q5K1_9BACI|nr:hypothetical protein [Salirhabdus euzebyi]MBB6453668.1 peptidoglycan hydrolase CwlO-like protein [Salirhabdus euzebyi]
MEKMLSEIISKIDFLQSDMNEMKKNIKGLKTDVGDLKIELKTGQDTLMKQVAENN